MKAELVKKEGNKVTLKITVDNNKFEEAVNKAYNKTKGKYNIPGFRKGKAPKVVIGSILQRCYRYVIPRSISRGYKRIKHRSNR